MRTSPTRYQLLQPDGGYAFYAADDEIATAVCAAFSRDSCWQRDPDEIGAPPQVGGLPCHAAPHLATGEQILRRAMAKIETTFAERCDEVIAALRTVAVYDEVPEIAEASVDEGGNLISVVRHKVSDPAGVTDLAARYADALVKAGR